MQEGDIDPQVRELMRAAGLDKAREMGSQMVELVNKLWSREILFHALPVLRFGKVGYHL